MKDRIVKKRLSKKWTIVIMAGLMVLFTGWEAHSQGVSMHTQGITQQEFVNPAYNSFKDQISFSAYNRMQWKSEYKYSPETQVANFFLPINTTRLGLNLGVIREDIGLRKTTELKLSLCHNIQLSENGRLAFGYSVGFLQNALMRDKVINYQDEDLTDLLAQVSDYESFNPTVSLGLFFLAPKWYMGISSMTTSVEKDMSGSQYLPGFDFSFGGMFRLNSFLQFRPNAIFKYYDENGYYSDQGIITKSYKIPPVFDIGANFLLANKVWLGTSHRFNQAQTFSMDLKIGKIIKVGYTFEWGLGEGLFQYNSHGIRLAYSIKLKPDKTDTSILSDSGAEKTNASSFIY